MRKQDSADEWEKNNQKLSVMAGQEVI